MKYLLITNWKLIKLLLVEKSIKDVDPPVEHLTLSFFLKLLPASSCFSYFCKMLQLMPLRMHANKNYITAHQTCLEYFMLQLPFAPLPSYQECCQIFFQGMFENGHNDETNADTSEIDTARPLVISKLEF